MEFMEDVEDVGLDNTEVNCHKCVKASFKFRKVFYLMDGTNVFTYVSLFQELFCQKCLDKGMVSAEKAPLDNCKKCRKPKYFQKHLAYCEVKCTEYSPDEVTLKTKKNSFRNFSFVKRPGQFWNYFQDEMTTALTTPEIPSSTTAAPDLGPLGNLFKLLVQANTWTH